MCFASNHVEEWVSKFSSQTLPFRLATVAALFMLGKSALWHFYSDPLKAFPGPFLARYTNLWRLVDYYQTTQARSHRKLHVELGPAVRIGPDMVILNDPALLKTVYSTRGEFVKSDFYEVGDTIHDGYRVESVFTTRSNHFHARYMKPYQKYFKMDIILSKEHLLDDMVKTLCQQLERRFVDGGNSGKTADLAEWIEYAAWDLDWQMTFSEDFGFLKTGTDVQGMIHTGETIMRYLGCVGQMPFLDRLLGKNKYCPIRFATFEHAAAYSFGKLAERSSAAEKQVHGDFLDNFLEEKEQHPDIVTNNEIVGYLMMNVLAGGDTTAIVQKAIAWYVLSHPNVHKALVAELDAAHLSFPPRYEETRYLPYLDAVIREGQRMHPVITGILERIVPGPGLALPDGRVVPAGTKVGINPWVSSRDRATYGDDADDFRPERWLREAGETEAEYAMRLRRMKDADFTFGGGRRACVGRNMAAVELHKVTATLFSRYNIKLDRTRKQWSQKWWWFSFVDHIQVKMSLREAATLA